MTRGLKRMGAVAAVAWASAASATPSTAFWTPATIETQPFLVPHLTYDTWFGEAGALQIDAGLTIGVVDARYLQVEAGFDLYFPTLTPSGQMGALDFAQVNARATLPEDAVAPGFPGLSVGVAKVGFKEDVSDFNLVHGTMGTTTRAGRFCVGAYYGAGSEALWTYHDTEVRGGFMASWVSRPIELGLPGLKAIDLRADLATGRNWLGGGAAGVGFQFTDAIALRTGAVVFIDWDYYERMGLTGWLWSLQLDVDVRLFDPKSP